MKHAPEFLILSAADCRDVLERQHVGRLAFTKESEVDIEPIGYVYDGTWIFFRSAWGAKLEALQRNPSVAFEVDEAMGLLDWRSVVAHGTVYQLPGNAPAERDMYDRALAAIRRIVPEIFTPGDPTPSRTFVCGMHIDTMIGRMARNEQPKDYKRRAKVPERPAPGVCHRTSGDAAVPSVR